MARGRGAWSVVGKDNDSVCYEYIDGKPRDGSNPTKDASYLAVNYAVKAIQSILNIRGFSGTNSLVVDGDFGPATSEVVNTAQAKLGLPVTGQVDAKTNKGFWFPLVQTVETKNDIPGHYLCGLIRFESNWDPGAVGFVTDNDHGMCQINGQYNPAITLDQVFDPSFAIPWAGRRLAASLERYDTWEPAIASYNSPSQAKKWKETGLPPGAAIAKYVSNIMQGDPST